MTAVRILGMGGEGEVFELAEEASDARFALKWFHAERSTPERRAHIAELVRRGSPADNFLWPQGLIEDVQNRRFGYVMDLRPPEFSGLAALLRGDVARSEPAVVRFAFELAKSFMALHTRGMCYRDINFGNAFIEPRTGEALICDNDNVGIDGVSQAMVMGSKKFMAPEIVRKEAVPSVYTDRYSLAVMLFYLLVVHHPLEGALTDSGLSDAESDLRHYGYEAVFCFDPENTANRPDPNIYPHVETLWNTYPQVVRDLFTRSFVEGLQDGRSRVVDSEWCHALAHLISVYYPCETCGRPLYLESDDLPSACPNCGKPPSSVMGLAVGSLVMPIRVGAQVSGHHVQNDFDMSQAIGTVISHPSDAQVHGLRNDSGEIGLYTQADGTERALPPGRSGRLEEGVSFTLKGVHMKLVDINPGPNG